MKTDRELLELAAKAAGYKRTRIAPNGMNQVHGWHEGYDNDWEYWDPIFDEGDAQRLAVKLYLVVAVMRATHDKPAFTAVYHFNGPEHVSEMHGEDANAATRRAIVRAAAAIGEAMQ
jgi:hypothetical protein